MLVELLVFLGITLMIYSIVLQRRLVGIVHQDDVKMRFNYLLALIVLFLIGYIFFLWMYSTMEIDSSVSLLVGVILFFGAIFVVAVLGINYMLINSINEHADRLEMLNRVLDKRRAKTESDLKDMKEKEAGLLKEISGMKERNVPENDDELKKKLEELQEFQRVAVGRELRMIELKKKLLGLEKKGKKGQAEI